MSSDGEPEYDPEIDPSESPIESQLNQVFHVLYAEDLNVGGAKSPVKYMDMLSLKTGLKRPTKHWHEVIDGKVKPYFDFDLEVPIDGTERKQAQEIARNIRDIISSFYKCDPKQVCILSACGLTKPLASKSTILENLRNEDADPDEEDTEERAYKISFHAIVNGCGYYKCGRVIKDHVLPQLPKVLGKHAWDDQPYKLEGKKQFFRMPYCSKLGSKRALQLVVFGDSLKLLGSEHVSEDMLKQTLAQWTNGERFIALEPKAKQPGKFGAERGNLSEAELMELLQGYDVTNYRKRYPWMNMVQRIQKASSDGVAKRCALAWSLGDPEYANKKCTVESEIDRIFAMTDFTQVADLKREGKSLLYSSFTDGDVADSFMSKYGDMFKYFDCKIYHFNGAFWERCPLGTIFAKIDEMYWELDRAFQSLRKTLESKQAVEIFKNMQRLRASRCLQNFWIQIKCRIEITEDIFDADPYLLGFMNGTYDLKAGEFRGPQKEDYISRVVPYDYSAAGDRREVYEFIDKVMPIREERDFILKVLATGLDGQLLENIIMLLGNGRNGKDTLMNLWKASLGEEHYYDAPNYILTERLKVGANPEVANMHKKRAVVYNEPNKKATLNCSTIKELTGRANMPIRGLYSSNNKTTMAGTHVILQNSLLNMDTPDDAMLNRLYVVPFRSMFRTEDNLKTLPEGTQHAYLVNSYYKTAAFLEKNKSPFMNVLLEYYARFRTEGFILKNAPASILEASRQCISDSDEMVSWFKEQYEFTNDESSFVKMKDIYGRFKTSDLWNNMNKSERRKMTKAKLEKDISSNPTLRPFYKQRLHTRTGVDVTNVMVKYKERSVIEEVEE